MVKHTNLLLIGGSGQNVGKTTFTTDILKTFASKHNIIAIKTSCHFHGILDTDIVIANNEKYVIVKETVINTGKDSARMLESGALEVYFIQAKDINIGEAYNYLTKTLNPHQLTICESASLRKHLIPQIFLALTSSTEIDIPDNKLILNKADLFIEDYLENKNKVESYLGIKNNEWRINN